MIKRIKDALLLIFSKSYTLHCKTGEKEYHFRHLFTSPNDMKQTIKNFAVWYEYELESDSVIQEANKIINHDA